MWGASAIFIRDPLVNLWTVGTVRQKFVSVSSVLLSVSHFGENRLHPIVKVHQESDSNISSVKSQSLSSLFGAILLNALSRQLCTQKTQHLNLWIMLQASALPDLLQAVALTRKVLNFWVDDTHKHEITVHKNYKEILVAEWRSLPLVTYCTYQCSEHLYAFVSFPIDCIWIPSPLHPHQPTLPQNPNISIRLKPKNLCGHMMKCTLSSKFYSTGFLLSYSNSCF